MNKFAIGDLVIHPLGKATITAFHDDGTCDLQMFQVGVAEPQKVTGVPVSTLMSVGEKTAAANPSGFRTEPVSSSSSVVSDESAE